MTIPDLLVAFDLETAEESELFRREDFIRLCGYSTGHGVRRTTDVTEVMAAIGLADTVTGHNIMGFDLIALARHAGLDLWELLRRGTASVLDTKLLAFLADPPPARMNSGWIEKYYSLDSVGQRLVGEHKANDLKKLAKKYGGFDAIPTGDFEFQVYLDQDVNLNMAVLAALDAEEAVTPYALREHQVAGLAAQVTLNGFAVDERLLEQRVAGVVARRKELIERLVNDYGLPMFRKDGSPAAAPQNTQAGRAAIKAAFEAAGAPYMPKTPKKAWATGADAMRQMIGYYADLPEVIELAEVVQALNGQRTVYETTRDNLVLGELPRVHPRVALRQASGRWSLTRPGLTVMGKRGGRHVEREVFIPDPGQMIVCIDLAQIDARAVAVLSQDENYMNMFGEGKDLHSEIARRVFGTADMREPAKVAGHGWNYGLGIDKLISQFGIDRAVAAEFYKSMREQFPRLVQWKEEMAEIAKSGELLDNGLGRKMRPDVGRAYTQGPALMGQGCARDLFMEGLLGLPDEVLPMLRGVVHDEVVLSVPSEDVDDVEKAVVDAMSFEWTPPGIPGARPISVIADAVGRSRVSWGAVYQKQPKPEASGSAGPASPIPPIGSVSIDESETIDYVDDW